MTSFLIRFATAGLLVASLPWIANHFGDLGAGVLLLFPVVTLAGFITLGTSRGNAAVAEAALGSVAALPGVAIFLVTVALTARTRLPLSVVLSVAVSAWLLAAVVALKLISVVGGSR